MFEVRDGCEELAESDADAEFFHGGFHLGGAHVAAVAGDVAVIGEGVDDGAGAADVGQGRGAVGAFWEGEEGGELVGFGVRHVGVVCCVRGKYLQRTGEIVRGIKGISMLVLFLRRVKDADVGFFQLIYLVAMQSRRNHPAEARFRMELTVLNGKSSSPEFQQLKVPAAQLASTNRVGT